MHIKRHTKGTSNEISFDVLEAKKGEDSSQEEDSNPLGKISMFTLGKRKPPSTPSRETNLPTSLPASISSSKRSVWSYPHDEVVNKKAKRKRGKRLLVTTVSACLLIIMVIAAFAVVQGINRYQEFIGNLDAQVEVVDEVYNSTHDYRALVEEAINTPLPEIDVKSMQERFNKFGDLSSYSTKLRATKTAIENLQPNLTTRSDTEKANDALTSINAQLNMYEIGNEIITDTLAAAENYALAASYMTLVLQADSAAREAASITYEMNDQTAQASLDKSNEAMNLFASARDNLQSTDQYKNNDSQFEPYIEYVNTRIDAQQAAIDTDRAYMSRSSAGMIEANERYNSLEFEAAGMYSEIKDQTPADLVVDDYKNSESIAAQIAAWNAEAAKCKPLI